MAYYGKSLIFDGTPSDMYGLFIAELDTNGINSSMASNSVQLYEQKLFRRSTPYFFGSTSAPHLEFDMSLFSEDEISAEEFQLIQKWLFGSKNYKKFQIVQPDMQSVYFMSLLNSPEVVKVGNQIRGCKFKVICDSPFGWRNPKTTTYTYISFPVDNTVTFNNRSDDVNSYLYPSLVITMSGAGGDISITNLDDDNRVFSFTGLSSSEVITMDCGLQTLSSSTGLKRLSKFNKHYLRFVPGNNRLHIEGQVASIAMTTQFVAKTISG